MCIDRCYLGDSGSWKLTSPSLPSHCLFFSQEVELEGLLGLTCMMRLQRADLGPMDKDKERLITA
jgi:hypothetical protein